VIKPFEQYLDALVALVTRIRDEQSLQIRKAAQLITDTLIADGLVHTFGTGHSHLLAEEAFFRAGGLVAVDPIRDYRLMMLEGAIASTRAEREHGLARSILVRHEIRPGDVAVIISNSGRNAVPIEMALEMRAREAKVVAITSLAQSGAATSRHASGKRLFELADVVLDNGVPEGDALIRVPGIDWPIGPASTVAGAALMNGVLVEAAALAAARGRRVAVLRSANLEEGNAELERSLEPYRDRVPALGRTCNRG
jgi:uncharacterized phosphosugar-binding protein